MTFVSCSAPRVPFVTESRVSSLHTFQQRADRLVFYGTGVLMLESLFFLIAKNLSGTGMFGILLASVLGVLLISDARRDAQTAKQRSK